jgi:DNA-directed RNA polymerase specialized sigma24 family protein
MPLVGLTLPAPVPPAIMTKDDFDKLLREWLIKAERMARWLRIAEPEDAAQNVITAVWANGYIAKWEPGMGTSLNTWIYRVVEKRLLDELRRQRRRRDQELLTLDGQIRDSRHERGFDEVDAEQMGQAVIAQLNRASDRFSLVELTNEILNLIDEPFLKSRVAGALGCSWQTAQRRLQRLGEALAADPDILEVVVDGYLERALRALHSGAAPDCG